MRKVFLDELPKWTSTLNKGKTNWIEAIGLKVKFVYDDIKGEIEIIDYMPDGGHLYVKYLDKDILKTTTGVFKKCQLGKFLGKHTNEFKIKIGTTFKDEKRDLIITDNEYRKDLGYSKYTCNKCGWTEGWCKESHLLAGVGCSCCSGRTTVEGINDISTTDPWMIPYFQENYDEAKLYTSYSKKKIYPICPDCKRVKPKQIPIRMIKQNRSIGCTCGDGKPYPEKFVYSLLEQLKIAFEIQYSPEWISPKRYDFYFELNGVKYIIETDGGWHDVDNLMNGQTVQDSKAIDTYKDTKAEENNIEVIRIDCIKSELEYIKNNILLSRLNKLFNLNKVDWVICEEFALSNLVKVISQYKKNNPEITSGGISKLFSIHQSTIIRYLKRGCALGWCEYDVKEEKEKNNKSNGTNLRKRLSKEVEIFKDGFKLGTFESCLEIERSSKKLFGVNLDHSMISAVCLGKRNIYKGYTFIYT